MIGDSMETKENTEPPKELVELVQCSKSKCGYVLTTSEYVWGDNPGWTCGQTATCPKCGRGSFYYLNAQGQARKMSDKISREIDPETIEPSPRMGLKMKRRILAAKRRALLRISDERGDK
jgi:hypothetical protein